MDRASIKELAQGFRYGVIFVTVAIFWIVLLSPSKVLMSTAGRLYASAEQDFWRGYASRKAEDR